MSQKRSTLYPNGVSNASPRSFEGQTNLRFDDPTKYHKFFDDFDRYNDVSGAGEDWTITQTGAGTDALVNGDGGILSLLNAAADDDSTFLQLVRESFAYEADKELWFKIKLNISNELQSDIIAGFWNVDGVDPIDTPPTRGIFFVKDQGTDLFSFKIVQASTETEFVISTAVVAGVDVEMAFHYDGVGTFTLYQDDVLVGTVTDLTNVPDATILALGFGMQNGNANARTMLTDYLLAVKER